MNGERRPGGGGAQGAGGGTTRTITPTPDTLVAAALEYASRGWPVLPTRPWEKAPCTQHGFEDASTDPGVIARWWRRWPAANVGIATGSPAVDVLDVDTKPGQPSGFPALNRLKAAGLLAGAQAIVATPSGGLHLYFVGTGQQCGRIPQLGLDLKARGGYVLAPPSIVAGRCYERLEERDTTGRIDWAACRRFLVPPPAAVRRATSGRTDLSGLARWMARQQPGSRNSALYWAACRATEAGHGDDLEQLLAAAVEAGLEEAEARRTISSAQRRVVVS